MDFLLLTWLDKSGADVFLITSELLLLLFAALVAVGVLGETFNSAYWQPWHRTFAIVVFIGVAGEMIADAGVFISSARLQEIQGAELTQATKVATIARGQAIDANELATAAIGRAAALEKEAADARERAAKLEKDNLGLQAEVLELRKSVTWRDLTIEQNLKIVANILRTVHVPPTHIVFDSVVGNPEAKRYGDLLSKALSSAVGATIDEPLVDKI